MHAISAFALIVLTIAAVAFTYFQYFDSAGAATSTLFPNSDKSNTGSWTTHAGNPCNGVVSTVCSAVIDEDVDAPIDADYIQSPIDAVSAQSEFHLLDASVFTSKLTDLSVRYRAYKTGSKAATIKVEVVTEGGTVVGSPPTQVLTGSATTYSYNLSALTFTQAETDHLYLRITGAVSGVGTSTRVAMTVVNTDTTHTEVAMNPALPSTCGIDIALVADTSGSIDAGELQDQKDAFNSFIDILLPGTPTNMALVDFDTEATVTQGFTSSAASMHTGVNAFVADGLTNWEDAIRDARNLFPHRNDKPDLIVFASDGDPNTIGTNGGTTFVGEQAAMHAAIVQADLAKNAGIRILALGVGTDPEESNLESISSFDAVTLTNFADLEQELFDLATDLCGGQISVHKLIDADGNPGTTGDQTSTGGWFFNANVTSGGGDNAVPPSGFTDGFGYFVSDIGLGPDNMATVNVVETVQSGYALIAASCMAVGNGPLGTWTGNAVNGINVGVLDIVQCTFINSVQKPFTVQKDFQPDAPGSVTVSLSCASGVVAPASAPASEATPANFTVTGYSGNPNCTATESSVPAGYDSSGTCIASLNTGVCQIVNVLRTANVTVNKDFSDNNMSNVTIALACTSGTVAVNDNTASESDGADFVVTGFNLGTTCTATEATPPGYTANQAGCATIAITPGGNHSCTIINTLNQATLTVYKDFVPDNNVIVVQITLTCTSGSINLPNPKPASEGSPAVFTIVGFTPGTTCTATETAPPGYNGNQAGCAAVAIMPGGSHNCTITNSAITYQFTVQKDFSDNNPAPVTVTLSCPPHTVTPSSALASEATPAVFTVIAVVGNPICTATESPIPTNYTSSGTCGAALVTVGTCTIVNQLDFPDVLFQVYKDFTDDSPAPVLIALACAPGPVTSVIDATASEGDPADFTVEVQPNTHCWASEAVPFGYAADESDCQMVPVSDFQCTIINSPEPVSVGGEVTLGVTKAGGSGLGWPFAAALLALPLMAGSAWVYARRRID